MAYVLPIKRWPVKLGLWQLRSSLGLTIRQSICQARRYGIYLVGNAI